jgi:hypothetical protein
MKIMEDVQNNTTVVSTLLCANYLKKFMLQLHRNIKHITQIKPSHMWILVYSFNRNQVYTFNSSVSIFHSDFYSEQFYIISTQRTKINCSPLQLANILNK